MKHFFTCILLSFLLISCNTDKKPNFVIFLADDLGYGDVKFTNPEAFIETPNLDKLAAAGTILTDCYSASSMCSPSRAGLLTGRSPTRIGIHDWIKEAYKKPYSNIHLPAEEITIAELLQSEGYKTALIGKWHLNNAFNSGNNSDPGDHGFDYWFSTDGQSEPSHKNPENFYENGVPEGKIGTDSFPRYSSGILAEKTELWLDDISKNQAFFLYVSFHEPHVICDAPQTIKEKYLNRISNGDIPLIAETGEEGLGQAEYYASVENMDWAIGRIISKLQDKKILSKTWIFFSSDNGPDTGRKFQGRLQSVGRSDPFSGRKRWLFEGGIRQASIMVKEGDIEPGNNIQAPVGHVDMLPTICDILKIDLPQKIIDGTSILQIIQTGSAKRIDKPLHWHFYSPRGNSPQSVLRKDDWIITADWDTDRPPGRFDLDYIDLIKSAELINFNLYNIIQDPKQNQTLNLQNKDLFEDMKQSLIDIHREVKEECPNRFKFEL